jgi:predicted DNA-binding protein
MQIMSQMIRKQVYIEKRHERMLKRRAKQRGVTQAEIVREALDKLERDSQNESKPNPEAVRELIESLRSFRNAEPVPGGRDWTRDDLYEERIGRWIKS